MAAIRKKLLILIFFFFKNQIKLRKVMEKLDGFLVF